MAKRRPNLADTLRDTATGKEDSPLTTPATSANANVSEASSGRQRSRIGKVNITGYFPLEVKASLKLIQAKAPNRSVQSLLGEALNDLFAKHGVPEAAPRDY